MKTGIQKLIVEGYDVFKNTGFFMEIFLKDFPVLFDHSIKKVIDYGFEEVKSLLNEGKI